MDHAAQLQFHTGRHIFDGFHPSIGSWVHYGLGSLNDNLPQFVVMGPSPGDCCGGIGAHDGSYLGPSHSGVPLTLDPANPLPFGTPGASVTIRERRNAPAPNGGWPEVFESWHRLGMFAIVTVLVAALFADDAQPEPDQIVMTKSEPDD